MTQHEYAACIRQHQEQNWTDSELDTRIRSVRETTQDGTLSKQYLDALIAERDRRTRTKSEHQSPHTQTLYRHCDWQHKRTLTPIYRSPNKE